MSNRARLSKKQGKELKKKVWLGEISDKKLAQQVISEMTGAVYFLVFLQILIGALLFDRGGFELIIDSVVIAIINFFIKKFHSRIAAVILLVFAVVIVLSSFAQGGFVGLPIKIIFLWIAFRIVKATFFSQTISRE